MRATNPSANSTRLVDVQMRNIVYHYTEQTSVHIVTLRGQLEPIKGDIPVFDDKTSFILRIASAEMTISPASLSNVLNSWVFNKPDAPLKGVAVQIDQQRLRITGRLHSKGDIAFETEGEISASQDGRIRLHTDKVKALHVPVKGLMDLLGLQIANLIKTGKVQGVEIENDDILLDPTKLLPPPRIEGKITAVRLEGDAIVEVFGGSLRLPAMNVPYPNYMAYRGNKLRFGKLTMADTDMVIIDMNPQDPFDFFLDHYPEQLVAGYTKQTPAYGLRVYMRDYNKLPGHKAGRRNAP